MATPFSPGKCFYKTARFFIPAACALFALFSCTSVPKQAEEEQAKPVFKEIWAYLLQGEEDELTGEEPITHICYVGAGLAKNGRITDAIPRPEITRKDGVKPQIHVLVAELSNPSLSHFSLDPQYGVRPLLLDDICRIAEDFDGVQIDFEAVSRDDADSFFGFLEELKSRLPAGKMLSVAIPARTKSVQDAYDYSRISAIVDRVVIMAYDEHWSGGSPGPVASLSWCARVLDYARSQIDKDKLIMGLPLYGRAWQDKRLAKAMRYQAAQDIVSDKKSSTGYTSELGAYFEYSENVVVKVFYEDDRSLLEKLKLYEAGDVHCVSFWRIGQSSPEFWSKLANTDSLTAPAADADPAAPSPDMK